MNDEIETKKPRRDLFLPASILIAALMIAGAWMYANSATHHGVPSPQAEVRDFRSQVIPPQGVALPVIWGDLGRQMVAAGVIEEAKFESVYASRGGLSPDMKTMLDGSSTGQITINSQNAGIILNLLWALGLSNKNPVLDTGPMQNPQYGGASRFASTAGWTLARGSAMNYYSELDLVNLTADQQSLVEAVAKNIYRPCCGNSSYFPDCNHGMAMLGLLELMVSQGATADQMYKAALAVNSYWFSDNYLTIAQYLQSKGVAWNSVKPEDILAANFSSAQGYQQIIAQAQSAGSNSPGGCGV